MLPSKCVICGKKAKENTMGNIKYCQGHSPKEMKKYNEEQAKKRNAKG